MVQNFLIGILVIVIAIWFLGPREPVDLTVSFSEQDLGDDLDGYLAESEARVADLAPEHAKSIQWAGDVGVKTDFSIVYIHGFSATKEEIRPVPDDVAAALGANLFYTRLTGHGRNGAAMAQTTVNDWLNDAAEALAIGRRLGDRVIVISSSTGGTILTLLSLDRDQVDRVAGAILMSPNFGIQASGRQLLTMPFARQLVPLITGETRSWEPQSEAQRKHWATSYPSVALLPMAAAVQMANESSVEQIIFPALFMISPDDQVVSPEATRAIAKRWSGATTMWEIAGAEVGDASAHVLAGDIVSPATNKKVTDAMIAWIRDL